MNRLDFFKRLVGGVIAAPIVAKAICAEPKPDVPAYSGVGFLAGVTGFPLLDFYRDGELVCASADIQGDFVYYETAHKIRTAELLKHAPKSPQWKRKKKQKSSK